MMRAKKKKKIIYSVVVAVILMILVVLAWPEKNIYKDHVSKKPQSTAAHTISSTESAAVSQNTYPTDEASSIWVVVNKGRILPTSYAPANLVAPNVPLRLSSINSEMHVRADTAAAMEKMFAAAKIDGISLKLESGYRSYAEQASVYAGYVSASGQQQADTFSARPGHSEHQTGLAADIEPSDRTCEVEQCFETTPEGKWLAANAYKYGFTIRYKKNTQNLTGYEFEPWHIRYVGIELAAQLNNSGQTLEQYFNLPIYIDYPPQSLVLKD